VSGSGDDVVADVASDVVESDRRGTASVQRRRDARWFDSGWFAVLLTLSVLGGWCVSGLVLVIQIIDSDSLPPPPPRSTLPDFDDMSEEGTWDGRPSSTEFYVFYDATDGQSADELLSAASTTLGADGWDVAQDGDVVYAMKDPHEVVVRPPARDGRSATISVSLAFTSPEAAEKHKERQAAAESLRAAIIWGFTLALTAGWGAVLYRRVAHMK
jgi:hypothetical protein